MEKGEHLRRQNRPSMLQLKYLQELKNVKKKRGAQRVIAERCGVNASTINRYFKACIEKGILEESLEFTEEGEAWFERYWNIYIELTKYLQEIGAKEEEARLTAEEMIENTDIHMLKLMINSHERQKTIYERKTPVDEGMQHILKQCERHLVEFCIYKLSKKWKKNRFSMAMHGFEEEAWLVQKESGSYLELQLKDMRANSRLNGVKMFGHLSSLKYEHDGTMVAVPIDENIVRLPLEAFKLHCWQGGENIGVIPITVTCSVGRQHMPESTALLAFWA